MNQKRLHLLLGIGGIYLALLTIYLCLAAGVLLVSTLRSMILALAKRRPSVQA